MANLIMPHYIVGKIITICSWHVQYNERQRKYESSRIVIKPAQPLWHFHVFVATTHCAESQSSMSIRFNYTIDYNVLRQVLIDFKNAIWKVPPPPTDDGR